MAALKYNTAIAALMEYVRFLQQQDTVHREEAESLVLLLAPLAPHIAEELWSVLEGVYSVHQQPWPIANDHLAEALALDIAVQVNGKTRGVVSVAGTASEEEIKQVALALASVQRHVQSQPIKRAIYVQGRLLNLVV